MNKFLTDITLVVDRSGSMHSIQEDAQGGVNSFIQQQADQQDGQANLTLYEFDNHYEKVIDNVPVQNVEPYCLAPRGSTALLDAVGQAIVETGQRLATMPEQDRPGLVVFVVLTDGHENASREFSLQRVREMIEHQQDQYNWQFTFLGADASAFDEANQMGMKAGSAAQFSKRKVSAAYFHTSNKVNRMRKQAMRGEQVSNNYTVAEHQDMIE